MNFFYQSLAVAASAGLPKVKAGMRISLKVDLLLAHDGTAGKMIQAWDQSGSGKVFDGQKVVITLDHQFPAPTVGARTLHKQIQDFAAQEGIRIFNHGEGVLHQVVAEYATPWPGEVIVGGCTGGRFEDMKTLIRAMGGRNVHPETTLLVTPASARVMEATGLTHTLRLAGAVINPPGCGPCPGLHLGILAPGDRAVATSVRNVPGRMGAPEAEIYLDSPYTAGLAAASRVLAPD